MRNFREQHHEDFSGDNEDSEAKPDAEMSSDDYDSEQYDQEDGDPFDSEEDGNLNYVEGS